MAALLDHDPLVQNYRAYFSLLDWSVVEHWQDQRSSRGRPAHQISAYLKAFLVRIREGLTSTSQLRRFLRHRPRCWSSNWAFTSHWMLLPLRLRLRPNASLRAMAAPEIADLRSSFIARTPARHRA